MTVFAKFGNSVGSKLYYQTGVPFIYRSPDIPRSIAQSIPPFPFVFPMQAGALCFHAAAIQGHVEVIRALAQKGAVIDARDKDNYTSLHLAVRYCRPLVVQALLGYGADTKLKGGKAGEAPLHIAARSKDGEAVTEMLIKSGFVHRKHPTFLHVAVTSLDGNKMGTNRPPSKTTTDKKRKH